MPWHTKRRRPSVHIYACTRISLTCLRAHAFPIQDCVHTHLRSNNEWTVVSEYACSQTIILITFILQESLLAVLKKGELLAFVGPDVGNRLWIGELIRDANPNDQLLEVSWLKVLKIQRDFVYLTKDSKAGQDQVSRDSCLGSVTAQATSARNRITFSESDWNQLVTLAVREGIALSDAANVGVTVLPTLATHTFTATNASLVGLAAKDISLDDQRLIFCCHCTRIQPVVDQVNYLSYFPH